MNFSQISPDVVRKIHVVFQESNIDWLLLSRKFSTILIKCVVDALCDLMEKVDRKAWISQEMINKMDGQRIWKTIYNKEGIPIEE